MPKEKGTKKTGGRKVGTPNKSTSVVKQSLQEFFETNWLGVQDHYDGLPPKEKLVWLKEILPYLAPKQSSNDNNLRFENLSDDALNALVDKLTATANEPYNDED